MLPKEILKRLTRADRAGHWIDPLTGEVYSLGDWEPTPAKTKSPPTSPNNVSGDPPNEE